MNKYRLFIIDEERENLRLIESVLGKEYEIVSTTHLEEAKKIIKEQVFQVIITDQKVNNCSGLEFLNETRNDNKDAVRMILAGYADAEMLLNIINNSNVFRYILKPWDPYEIQIAVKNAIEKYVMAEENRMLVERLKENYSKTVMMLANALEARDVYAQGHSERVAYSSVCIAKRMKATQKEVDLLYSACLLHDIGRIGVPEDIYKKPGKLDEDDLMYIKAHTTIADRILSPIPDFKDMIPIIRSHHERLDGTGYPDGLVGEQIPFLAKVVAVTDTFDALTSDRPYRKGKTFEEAIVILDEEKGTHLDEEIVNLFISILKEKPITSIWEIE